VSVPVDPQAVLLFFAVLAAPDAPGAELRRRLEQEFSPILDEAGPYTHAEGAFYEPEMGPNLTKSIWFCSQPIHPGELVGIKLHTNRLEAHYARGQGRRLNIDPGYADQARVVLITGKDRAQRIYVGKGLYEEITLLYRKNEGFQSLPWTYPDYQRPDVLEAFHRQRQALRERLKEQSCTST